MSEFGRTFLVKRLRNRSLDTADRRLAGSQLRKEAPDRVAEFVAEALPVPEDCHVALLLIQKSQVPALFDKLFACLSDTNSEVRRLAANALNCAHLTAPQRGQLLPALVALCSLPGEPVRNYIDYADTLSDLGCDAPGMDFVNAIQAFFDGAPPEDLLIRAEQSGFQFAAHYAAAMRAYSDARGRLAEYIDDDEP